MSVGNNYRRSYPPTTAIPLTSILSLIERKKKNDEFHRMSDKLPPMTHQHSPAKEIVITKADNLEVEISSGAMNRLAGVSELLTGSSGIHMAIATVPPGRCSTAHYHVNCESAIYIVSGTGVFLSGPELDKEESINAGDFIFVPPDANHQPVNTSSTDDLVLIVARNAPVEIVVELEGKGRKDC